MGRLPSYLAAGAAGCESARAARAGRCAGWTAKPAGRPAIGRSRMEFARHEIALVVGAGQGLSASLARLFTREGMRVALAARHPDKLDGLCRDIGARAIACDATKVDEVENLFAKVEKHIGVPDVVVYNASARSRGPLVDLDPAQVEAALKVSAFGGF